MVCEVLMTNIVIDVNAIPEYQKRALVEWAIKVTEECFAQPGMEEKYQEWLVQRNVNKQKPAE